MKRLKSLTLITILTLTVSTLLFSCMTTKTDVGAYRETQGVEYKYAKGKQFWLFWGILPLGRTKVNTPADGNCQIVTRFNVLDALISSVTGGLVTSYTIKIKAKRKEQNQVPAK